MNFHSNRIILIIAIFPIVLISNCASIQHKESLKQDQGSNFDIKAICEAIDKNPDGRITKKEFCTFFTNKELGKLTFDYLDIKNQGYLTKDEILNKRRILQEVIRLTEPRPLR
jgi:Ca2+-binding EF-hand superfamily protein